MPRLHVEKNENDKDSCANCRFWDKEAPEAIEENEDGDLDDDSDDSENSDDSDDSSNEDIEEEEDESDKGVCTIQSDGSSDLAYVSEIGDAVLLTRGDFFCNLYKVKQ